MKRSGRASVVVVAGVIGIVVIVFMALTSGESPMTVGNRFMVALAAGDTNTLADISIMGDKSRDEMKKEWEKTVTASKHFLFKYRVKSFEQPGPDQAAVPVAVERNLNPMGGSYDENYQIPLVKKDGKWKVDVLAMNRTMYPWLPR
ncbi:MAG: DUF4878 domain-containing protein [Armatimonadetes bacterium]|nr:DUF4878 domain-containing protein [Armatimonadota bacterium]